MLDPIDRTTESKLIDRIDQNNLSRHLDAFEDLSRFSGTEDQWEASEYVVDTLTTYGIEAELFEYEAYVSLPEDAQVSVTAPTSRTIDAITTAFSAATSTAGVHGEVVYVDDPDEIGKGEVSGKIAFTTGLPRPEMVEAFERGGAEGLIVGSETEGQLHEMIVTPVWGTPSTDTVDQIPKLPVAEIGQEDAEWLKERIEAGPTAATVTTELTTELRTLPLPVGRLKGTDSDRFMVIGNHVDSWYEGLTDNATAMASTLEIARIFAEHRPRRGLVFGFWSGHSFGRFAGSAWYSDNHWLNLRENGVAYLHLDLNGLKGADTLWYQQMAELEDEQVDVLGSVSDLPLNGDDDDTGGTWEVSDRPGRAADQSFWGAGLSSLLCGIRFVPGTKEGGPNGGGWWWHTPEDTRNKVDLDTLTEETEMYISLASRICNSTVLPHDFSATVTDIETAVADIDSRAKEEASFEAIEAALSTLGDTITAANEIINERAVTDANIARAAEDLQVTLGNVLVPTLYMQQQDYEHEPALPHELLPYLRIAEELPNLNGRDRRFAETKLQRGRTKLLHRINRANEAAADFVTEHR